MRGAACVRLVRSQGCERRFHPRHSSVPLPFKTFTLTVQLSRLRRAVRGCWRMMFMLRWATFVVESGLDGLFKYECLS